MSAIAAAEVGSLTGATRSRYWIESPLFDLAFFILAPLLTMPIVFGVKYRIVALAAAGIVLAVPHYLSTAVFYFWEENTAYQRSRWMTFFAGPVLLALVYCALIAAHVPLVIQIALFFWNTFHVARQNCGILGIYRNRAGVRDIAQKRVANAAIIATSVWFSLWYIDRHEEVQAILGPISGKWLWIASGSIALFCLVRLVTAVMQRSRRGELTSLPELAFLGMSMVMFAPYAVIRDINVATYVMLLPHYVQYLGIVWLVQRRRALEVQASDRLRSFSASVPLIVGTLAAVGVIGAALFFWSRGTNYSVLFSNVFILVALEHYYLDGVIWAFKNPHVRQTIGPFLAGRPAEAR